MNFLSVMFQVSKVINIRISSNDSFFFIYFNVDCIVGSTLLVFLSSFNITRSNELSLL